MIGLHVLLRCRDLQIILGINFWRKTSCCQRRKRKSAYRLFYKVDLIPICFFILLQASKDAIQKGVNIILLRCTKNKKFIIFVWARNGIMKLIAYVLLFGNMFQNTLITYKGSVTFNRFGCTYIERSIRFDSKNVS